MDNVEKNLRYISYALSIIQIFFRKERTKELMIEIFAFAFSMIFFVVTKDVYLPMLIVLIVGSKDSAENKICNISLYILIIGTILTIFGNLTGAIPDIMTAKAFSTEMTRHSYGFYHSNVLPNNVLMIEILVVWRYRENIKKSLILLFTILHIVLYALSGSRMSLVVGIFFSIGLFVLEIQKNTRRKRRLTYKSAYFVGPISCVLSLLFMVLVSQNAFVKKVDWILSNRFWAALLKMQQVGMHFLNFYSNEQFYRDGITVDNGYLFLAMRYGLMAVGVIIIINIILANKYKMDEYKLWCIACVFIIGFIDNNFLSYRFLPFLIFTFLNNKKSDNKITV